MAESTSSRSYSSDPTLWLYTSLSSGSSQIVTATSRLETILKANRIPFKALDVATDEKARMLWGRRAGKRRLPGLVRMGMVIGDMDQIEEWNEYGELKEQLGEATPATASSATIPIKPPTVTSTAIEPVPAAPPIPTTDTATTNSKASIVPPAVSRTPSSITFAPEKSKNEQTGAGNGLGGPQASMSLAMRQLGQEAAARAKQNKSDALSARKAQLSSAEKSADTSQLSSVADTTSTTASETLPQDTSSTTDEKNVAPADTPDDTSNSKSSSLLPTENTVSSATEAVGPESPLPAAEDPITKIQDTAVVGSQSTKSSESVVSESSIPVSLGNLASQSPGYTMHRGSSISMASKEEIREIEEANKIPEEPEEEDEPSIPTDKQNEVTSATTDKQNSHSEESSTKIEEPSSRSENDKADIQLSTTKAGPISSTSSPNDQADSKTQEQAAAEPKRATDSVED